MKTKHCFILSIFSLILVSWGNVGHRIINYNAGKCIPIEMQEFRIWAEIVANHASDADERKTFDKSEGPRHYIDIENFDEYVSYGKISEDWKNIQKKYGNSFLKDNGTLPWSTMQTLDSLTSCLKRRDWEFALGFASDLGHYVADGFMPLHLTTNYDGQLTEQKGIHARYESSMINEFFEEIIYKNEDASYIENPQNYILEYIYTNHKYKDSILLADKEIDRQFPNHTKKEYKRLLWQKTKNLTIKLFKNATQTYANLLYTAWKNAGKPLMSQSILNQNIIIGRDFLFRKKEIPQKNIEIKLKINKSYELVKISIFTSFGYKIDTLVTDYAQKGIHLLKWNTTKLESGFYFYEIQQDNRITKHEPLIILPN